VIRGNPLLNERVHDPYRSGEKLRETTRCPQCSVHYRNGRWTWPSVETSAYRVSLCPACRRINDSYPAGEFIISGEFVHAHRAEILSRARHIEAAERGQHPLHRIIAIERRGTDTIITTTDIHLPHRLGHAFKDAWGGSLTTHYDREGHFARVVWYRER
jgi:hypothetical protein